MITHCLVNRSLLRMLLCAILKSAHLRQIKAVDCDTVVNLVSCTAAKRTKCLLTSGSLQSSQYDSATGCNEPLDALIPFQNHTPKTKQSTLLETKKPTHAIYSESNNASSVEESFWGPFSENKYMNVQRRKSRLNHRRGLSFWLRVLALPRRRGK